jgi:magnesium chelatase family protein
MLARMQSMTLEGIEAREVAVEVDIAMGTPAIRLTGMIERAGKECLVRVVSALRRCGFELPGKKITIGVSPAEPPKRTAGLDLAVALGLLVAERHVPPEKAEGLLCAGELTLAGTILPVRGALPMGLAARRAHLRALVLPERNAAEIAPWVDLPVLGPRTIGDLILHLLGQQPLEPVASPLPEAAPPPRRPRGRAWPRPGRRRRQDRRGGGAQPADVVVAAPVPVGYAGRRYDRCGAIRVLRRVSAQGRGAREVA